MLILRALFLIAALHGASAFAITVIGECEPFLAHAYQQTDSPLTIQEDELLSAEQTWRQNPDSELARRFLIKKINEYIRSPSRFSTRYQSYHPVIARALRRLLQAATFEEKSELTTMAQNLISNSMEDFSMLRRDKHPWALGLVSLLPFDKLPATFREQLKPWIRFDLSPPLLMDQIHWRPDGILASGSCENMHYSHICHAMSPHARMDRNYIPVLVDDIVIGEIKLNGDHSMLALRNVFDPEGHLILVAGGTYEIPASLNLNAAVLRLDSLYIKANEFLFNISDQTLADHWRSIKAHLAANGPLPASFEKWDPVFGDRLTEEQSAEYWALLLDRVQKMAERLERELKP